MTKRKLSRDRVLAYKGGAPAVICGVDNLSEQPSMTQGSEPCEARSCCSTPRKPGGCKLRGSVSRRSSPADRGLALIFRQGIRRHALRRVPLSNVSSDVGASLMDSSRMPEARPFAADSRFADGLAIATEGFYAARAVWFTQRFPSLSVRPEFPRDLVEDRGSQSRGRGASYASRFTQRSGAVKDWRSAPLTAGTQSQWMMRNCPRRLSLIT